MSEIKYYIKAKTAVNLPAPTDNLKFDYKATETNITNMKAALRELYDEIGQFNVDWIAFQRDYPSDAMDPEIQKAKEIFFGTNNTGLILADSTDSIVVQFQATFQGFKDAINYYITNAQETEAKAIEEQQSLAEAIKNI